MKKNRVLIFSFMLVVAVTSSVYAESIFGVTFVDKEVTFLVRSNGCTDTSSFKLIKPDQNSKTPILGIKRIRIDSCKKSSIIIKITYPLSDFGVKDALFYFKVKNEFTTHLGR